MLSRREQFGPAASLGAAATCAAIAVAPTQTLLMAAVADRTPAVAGELLSPYLPSSGARVALPAYLPNPTPGGGAGW